MTRIRITAGAVALEAELEATPSTEALLAALPFSSAASTWGEELYFEAPIEAKLEAGARQVVEPGTLCLWVEGSALALPWGRTPISTDARPKLVTRCNVLGRIVGDAARLAAVRAGDAVRVEKA